MSSKQSVIRDYYRTCRNKTNKCCGGGGGDTNRTVVAKSIRTNERNKQSLILSTENNLKIKINLKQLDQTNSKMILSNTKQSRMCTRSMARALNNGKQNKCLSVKLKLNDDCSFVSKLAIPKLDKVISEQKQCDLMNKMNNCDNMVLSSKRNLITLKRHSIMKISRRLKQCHRVDVPLTAGTQSHTNSEELLAISMIKCKFFNCFN